MNLYTFGLRYPSSDIEEIDVNAGSYAEARRKAEEMAREGYMPGWTLIDMPAGGSGGLVTVIRL